MNVEKTQSYSVESEFKDITLVMPSEMTDFIKKEEKRNENVILPPFHHQFTLHRIEQFRDIHKLPIPPHRKPVYDFIFVTNGKSVRSLSLDTFEVLPNHFCFLPAYNILTKEEMSKNIRGYYCHFDLKIFSQSYIKNDFIDKFPFLQSNKNPLVKVNKEIRGHVETILMRLEKIYKGGHNPDFNLISTYLLALFLEIKEYATNGNFISLDAAAKITQDYKNAMRKYIYKYNRISEFAKLLTITPNYLNRCVTTTTGRTARELLYDSIILEAKVLLKQTNLSISEIAYKLGKRDSSDFSRFFKLKTGMTPKTYKLL